MGRVRFVSVYFKRWLFAHNSTCQTECRQGAWNWSRKQSSGFATFWLSSSENWPSSPDSSDFLCTAKGLFAPKFDCFGTKELTGYFTPLLASSIIILLLAIAYLDLHESIGSRKLRHWSTWKLSKGAITGLHTPSQQQWQLKVYQGPRLDWCHGQRFCSTSWSPLMKVFFRTWVYSKRYVGIRVLGGWVLTWQVDGRCCWEMWVVPHKMSSEYFVAVRRQHFARK